MPATLRQVPGYQVVKSRQAIVAVVNPPKTQLTPSRHFSSRPAYFREFLTQKYLKKPPKKRPLKTLTNRIHFLSTFFLTRTVLHLAPSEDLQRKTKIGQNRPKCQGTDCKKIAKNRRGKPGQNQPACCGLEKHNVAWFYQF